PRHRCSACSVATPVGGQRYPRPPRYSRGPFNFAGYALSKISPLPYTPDYIEKIARTCVEGDEELFRVLYYDCAPYEGTAKMPVSGIPREFTGSDKWLHELARKDMFAVRLGILKFRGFKPKKIPLAPTELTDEDFAPDF